MRIDDHSYYLRYFKNAKRGESADLVYYKEVWDNGFTIDEFNIDENGLSFENANWNGINTDDSRAGTRILKRYYDKWVKLIEEARNKIVKLISAYDTHLTRNIMIGDCLYIPWKEIIEEEEATEREELGDDYEEDDNKYDGPDFWMLYVTGINEKEIEGHLISIDQWNTWYRPYPKTYSHKSLDRTIAIPKDAFEEAKNIIKTTVFTLLAEMKQKVNTIEIK